MSRFLMLGLYTSPDPNASLLLDASPYARGVKISTNEHGFERLTATIRQSLNEAIRFYSQFGVIYVRVTGHGETVWEGRLEDPSLFAERDEGIAITAFGYWRAMTDVPYTAIFSDTSSSRWMAASDDDIATSRPERAEIDTNNRLFITARQGETFTSAPARLAYLMYRIPDDSQRQLIRFSFDYDIALPANWQAIVQRFTAAGGFLSTAVSLTGTTTGTQNLSFSGCDMLAVGLFYSAGSTTVTGTTGDIYLKFTNLRVRTDGSTGVSANEIIAVDSNAILPFVNTINPTQIRDSAVLIENPLLDLQDELYEDQYPADILTRLAGLGDNQTPPRRWEVGVYDNRRLFFRPRGSTSRAWHVDATSLDVQRSLNQLYNSIYGTYQDANNRTLRTANNTDNQSVTRFGLTRRRTVSVQTTSETQANTHRDTVLGDEKDAIPRAGITFTAVYDAQGARHELWLVRAGDTITIRNLPPIIGNTIDRIRTFYISRTEYDVDTDTLTVEPEEPLPNVATLVARQQAGIR